MICDVAASRKPPPPRLLVGSDGSSAGESRARQRCAAPSAGRKRILVVEDDYFVSLTIADLIEAAGYAVLGPAGSGEEAIAIALKYRPDLVLMDIRLSGELNGIETATRLREANLPSIFVTANSDARTRELAQAASPRGWVEKPFSDETLIKTVAAAFSN